MKFFKDKNKIFLVISVLLLLFFTLTGFVHFYPPTPFDIEFSEEIQDYEGTFILGIMSLISWFGGMAKVIGLTLGTACLFYIANLKREAVFVASTIMISLINGGIKLLIERPRPTDKLVTIFREAEHHSFPSGHTSFYVVFFGFLIYLMLNLPQLNSSIRKIIISISAFLIASIAFSRIYLGVHWFTDVLGGFLLGSIVLIIIISIYERKKLTN